MKTLFIILTVSATWVCSQSLTRTVVATSGDNFSANGYSLSFTAGEFVSGTVSNGSVLTQGFQQADLFDISPVVRGPFFSEIRVFPNPTYGAITVQLDNKGGDYFYQLFDASGRALSDKAGLSKSAFSKLDLSEFSGGNYLLRVFSRLKGEEKVFKIIKKR